MTAIDKQFTETFWSDVPRNNWQKLFFKAPLQVWRLGLKFLLPPSFACITTEGHKTGLPRYTMVEFTEINDKFYIASGWRDKPHWVQNLMMQPLITLQPVRKQPIWGKAERAQDDDTLREVFEGMQHSPIWKPWLASLDVEPVVEDFIAKKDRVYIFEVTPSEGEMILPALPQDRRWVPWMVIGVFALVSRARFRSHKKEAES